MLNQPGRFFRQISIDRMPSLPRRRPHIRRLLIGLLLVWLPAAQAGQSAGDLFSIYLVRHAEKAVRAADPANPGLSPCGQQRAADLARILAEVGLESIFSTDYERTLATARPIAGYLQREIEIYDPFELQALSSQLLKGGQNALVVGHSNTTAVLAGLLAGEKGEEFEESVYDRLYQVVVTKGERHVYLMHQAFDCRIQAD